MNFDNNLRHRARPILLRQNEVVPIDESLPCPEDDSNVRKRLWTVIKYLLIMLIILGTLFVSVKWSWPYMRRTRASRRCYQVYTNVYNRATSVLGKLLKTTRYLKTDIFYRRKFMKFADVGFKKRTTVFRAITQLPRSLTSKLRKAFARIFSSSKVDGDASENNIVLNLFGFVAVRKNDNCIQQIPISPRISRPPMSSTFRPYRIGLAASSYNKMKYVLKRWNNIMDLVYSV